MSNNIPQNATPTEQQKKGLYDDIIDLPHPVSKSHPRMSMYSRAAQFAPFAALVGHDSAIREVARNTDFEQELNDDHWELLNRKMQVLRENLDKQPLITVSYFKPDSRKAGGEYLSTVGHIVKFDDYNHTITMSDGTLIPYYRLLDVACDTSDIEW